MATSTIQIVGDNIVMPALGTVDGVDISVAVPAAQAAADSALKFFAAWGNVAAAGVAAARFFGRTNSNLGTNSTVGACEYPVHCTGTYMFQLTARVSGTKLVTDTVALEIYKNGASTGITLTLLTTDTTKQTAATSLAVAAGDGICVRALQSGAEAQTSWNCSVLVTAL